MKKKSLVLLTCCLFATTGLTVSCAGDEEIEIALITDVGNIDDHSFNQATWEGVQEYANANNISHAYYRPTADSTAARVSAIDNAVADGADIIVLPGYLFNSSIKIVQEKYPDLTILAVDCDPTDDDNNYEPYTFSDKVTSIKYAENEAGFYAGYAAVKDGYTNIGFIGGLPIPAVIKYGQGYVYGANYAATEMGLADGAIKMNYNYAGSFVATPDITNKANSWYTTGTDVIFSCGGGIYASILEAANNVNTAAGNKNKKMIGVDVDQAYEADIVITSSMKNLKSTVVDYLTNLYNNDKTWIDDVKGKVLELGSKEHAVGLPTVESSWRFNKFTVDEYNAVYDKVISGEIEIPVKNVDNDYIDAPKVTVDYNA